jgi:hypothetical protein
MKNRVKMVVIIALVAVIGFTMAACNKGKDGNNNSNNGNNGGEDGYRDGDIVFSLDKTGPLTFTVTVAGANWKDSFFRAHLDGNLLFSSEDNDRHFIGYEYVRTSNKVLTCTIFNTETTVPITLRLTLGRSDGYSMTDGEMLASYKVNPDKSSITYPAGSLMSD